MGSKISSCSSCNPKPNESKHQNSSQRTQSLRRDGHVLRLWAEVFHVSASSGAVRWTQISDDLVPITVTQMQNRYHVTAYNSRVDKVLDVWLSCTRLGQASNCFVYWKDAITGDTHGLNFTSAADARAFRECISASRDFRRAESSYSLRTDGTKAEPKAVCRPSGGRQVTSQPNSPSKGKYLNALSARDLNQCTCDCMTSDVLHKQRNGRIRYSNFTRQDSGGTTQSSKSDGSVVRRQHERQQYFAQRGHVRSMEEQLRQKSKQNSIQRNQQKIPTNDTSDDSQRQQQLSRTTAQVSEPLRSKSQDDVRRVATTGTSTDDLRNDRTTTTTASSTLSSEALKRMLRDVQTTERQEVLRDRPKSLSEVQSSSFDRSRSHRSLEGRRRSLERSQCVDFTDASPPTPRHRRERDSLEEYETELRKSLMQSSVRESVQRVESNRDLERSFGEIEVFESLLKESMDDVQLLMREVQRELSLIRAEERRFKSLSTQSLAQLSLKHSSAPILDTLSIDGQLPFLSVHNNNYFTDNSFLHSIGSLMTSSEVSDDEKASLTTAISDDEDLDVKESPFRIRSGSSAANFECLGSVRKSGFLSVKKWLLRKKHSLELARKRGWKGYWVCLKGTTLLFYNCESRDGHAIDSNPKHLIFVDQCLVQSIPEHPKRDHVFCLSTAFGDAYLLDAPCLTERDHWIHAIHCACAAQLARNSGKSQVTSVLGEEIVRLEREIENDSRCRHETELLLSVSQICEEREKQSLVSSVVLLEEKMERKRIQSFRLKSYLNSVNESTESTLNTKQLLSLCSKRTKTQLNRLGLFTASSLHAFNCAKNPSIVGNLLKRQKSEEKTEVSSVVVGEDDSVVLDVVMTTTGERRSVTAAKSWTFDQLLTHLTQSQNSAREYYCRDSEGKVVNRNQFLGILETKELEIIPKVLFTVEMTRDKSELLFGFSVESELNHNDLSVFVSRIEANSLSESHGLKRGDEIVVLNGALVADLDMMFVESVLQEELSLCLMIRTVAMTTDNKTPQSQQDDSQTTDELIESMVCPPPPLHDSVLSDHQLHDLIVPKVDAFIGSHDNHHNNNKQTFETQLIHQTHPFTETMTTTTTTVNKSDNNADKMRKCVRELVDTEQTYCQSLSQLMTKYLTPLKASSLLSQNDVKVLFGSIVSVITAQTLFCQQLQRLVECEPISVEGIAHVFLSHAQHFRNYSTFCASHSRAQKLMSDEKTNVSLREWVLSQSCGQLSLSLESLLIKPIQRVLKYPLLLSQMKSFLNKESKEYSLISESLKSMEKVAEHINEMQRIHEEYGAIFEHLARNQSKVESKGGQSWTQSMSTQVDLSPTALIHYGGVDWLNCLDFLGKNWRKSELHSMCFVFQQFVCFLCKETIRSKHKHKQLDREVRVGSTVRTTDVEIIRHQTLIPVIEVQVRALNQSHDKQFEWELIQLKTNCGKRSEKIYKLANSTCEYRNAFLRTIRQIIREDVRQMSSSLKAKAVKQTVMTSLKESVKEETDTVKSESAQTQSDCVTEQSVSCGLCGKDVTIGRREQQSSHSSSESPVIWKKRQDSNSTSR